MNDYVSQTADIFSGMRLLIEGAIVLYEGDALPLFNLAKDHKDAQTAFSTIGKALYDLRQSVIDLEDACHEETKQKSLSRV